MQENIEDLKLKLHELVNQRNIIDNQINSIKQKIYTLETPQPPEFKVETQTEDKNIEKFIGGNVLGKVGIVIAAFGIIATIKIVLDKELLSNFGRIILGFAIGVTMIFFAEKNDVKHKKLSAILFTGGATIFFATAILARAYYEVFNSYTSFLFLMLICLYSAISGYIKNKFTRFTIATAAIFISPFCAEITTNNKIFYTIFVFATNAILIIFYNIKKWKSTFWIALLFSPALICATLTYKINNGIEFSIITAIFIFFYISAIELVRRNKKFVSTEYVFAIILNSLIYSIIYSVTQPNFHVFSATLTIINIIIFYISKIKLKSNSEIWKTAITSTIIFFTITIVNKFCHESIINFDYIIISVGILIVLASKLIKDYKEKQFFENFSIIINILAAIVTFFIIANHLIEKNYRNYFNENIITSIYYILYCIILSKIVTDKNIKNLSIIVSNMFLFLVITMEISTFCEIKLDEIPPIITYEDNVNMLNKNVFYENFKYVLISVIALIYWTLWIILAKNNKIVYKLTIMVSILAFCCFGLYYLSGIRESQYSINYTLIARYLSYIILSFSIIVLYKTNKSECTIIKNITEFLIILTIIWVSTSEIINIFTLCGHPHEYKLWLSVHFGVCAVVLIVAGLIKNHKTWRYYGFSIIAADVIKIIFYDLWNNQLWIKALVFIVLGSLLLTISYIYNKKKIDN